MRLGSLLLAFVLGVQWTLGHFQIQAWTGGLVDADRAVAMRPSMAGRGGGRWDLVAATVWGAALAAVQLGPSWQFADLVGQTMRLGQRAALLLVPARQLVRSGSAAAHPGIAARPDDPYWFGLQTEGYEIALYVGTIPLIFVFLAIFSRPASRPTLPWKIHRADQFRGRDDAAVVA